MSTIELNETGLIELSKADVAIANLKPYLELKVNGLDDKAGLKRVHDARMEVRAQRIAIEKSRKELKADALEFGRRVDAEAKRLNELIEPIESHLEHEESIIEREKERIKAIEEKAKADKLQARLEALALVRAMVNPSNVQAMTDEQFARLLKECTDEFNEAEAKRIAEIERQEAERKEIERQRAEMEAKAKAEREQMELERKKLEAERAEQARIAAEQAAKLKAEQDEIAVERRRLDQLEFERQAKERAEREAIAKAERERLAEEERRKEAERVEAAEKAKRPDREKLQEYAAQLTAVIAPAVKTVKAKECLSAAQAHLATVIRLLKEF